MTPRFSHDPNDGLEPAGWPAPAPEEQARSSKLSELISREIEIAGGMIGFDRFMALALYAPGLGYYSAARSKFGEGGDFITAPELSPLFGRCLANQIAEVLEIVEDGIVLEAGAGSGALTADVLLSLESSARLPGEYLILELSATLRALQEQTLQRRAPHLRARVRWIDTLPPAGLRGVVFGNELLDAMPVNRFRAGNEVVELGVGWDGARFVERERGANPRLQARVAELKLAPGYCSEIGFQAEAWVRSVGERIEAGALLLIDYGFPRTEYYHPQRGEGTLMCHYRQRFHADPLILVGLQDISVHVDFSAIAAAGDDAGLELLGYNSQAGFLIGCGLASAAEELARNQPDARAHLLRTQAINRLTAPQEMGELFKAIAFGRGLLQPLRGFAVQDRRARL